MQNTSFSPAPLSISKPNDFSSPFFIYGYISKKRKRARKPGCNAESRKTELKSPRLKHQSITTLLTIALVAACLALPVHGQHAHSQSIHNFERGNRGGVAVQPDEKVLLWGTFTEINGTPRAGLSRLNADGLLDTTWVPESIPHISFVTVAGNEIMVTSRSTESPYGDQIVTFTFLDMSTGAVLERHDLPMQSAPLAVDFNADHIYFGGSINVIDGITRSTPARLSRSTGDLDITYDPAGPDFALVTNLELGFGGLFVAGFFGELNDVVRFNIAKVNLDATGTVDTDWNLDLDHFFSGEIYGIDVNGEHLYIHGAFAGLNGNTVEQVGRVDGDDATVDTSWRPLQGTTHRDGPEEGGLVVAGDFAYIAGYGTDTPVAGSNGLTRAHINGVNEGLLDSGFDPALIGSGGSFTTAVSSVSGLYLGGYFKAAAEDESAAYVDAFGIARLHEATGAPLSLEAHNFVSAADVRQLLVLPDNSILIGGNFDRVDGHINSSLCKFLPTGEVDSNFGVGLHGGVSGTASVSDFHFDGTHVYVAGSFTRVDQTFDCGNVFRMAPDGVIDTVWNPNATGGAVESVIRHGDHVYLGGRFTGLGATSQDKLARVSQAGAGAVDAGWADIVWSISEHIRDIATDGTYLYAGGFFEHFSADSLARYSLASGGAFDSSWQPLVRRTSSAEGVVNSLFIDGSSIYLSGNFNTVQSISRIDLAKISLSVPLTVDGGFDFALDTVGGFDSGADEMFRDGDLLIIAGSFKQVNGTPRERVAAIRLAPTVELVEEWNPNFNSGIFDISGENGYYHVAGTYSRAGDLDARGYVKLVPLPQSYVDWQNSDLGPGTYDMAVAGLRADPDEDGLRNVQEFHNRTDALDNAIVRMTPNTGEAGIPVLFWEDGRPTYQFIYHESSLPVGSETNGNLFGAWTPGTWDDLDILSEGYVRVTDTFLNAPDRLFFRTVFGEPPLDEPIE